MATVRPIAIPADEEPAATRADSGPRIAGRPRFLRRLANAITEEFSLDFRAQVAHVVSRVLPQFAFVRTRTVLLRAAGISIGRGSAVMGTLYISGSGPAGLLSIGDHTAISGPLHVDLGARVEIGSRVHLGQDVMLLTMDHEIESSDERCGRLMAAPIRIGDGAWIASRATILPGISVGRGAVVAAGAVVATDVPPDTLVGGVPARVLRHLDSTPPQSSRLSFAKPAK